MKGLIRFRYDKIIDASAQKPWDRAVFDDTYQEFFMQAQSYNLNNQYQTFGELVDNVPKADQLHYLTSRVAMGYLKQLGQIIPEVTNALGETCLPFTQFKFEILQSHVAQKEKHKIAISFYSDLLTWIDTVDRQLLLAYGDQRVVLQAGGEINTDLIALQPFLTIWSFQPTTPNPVG